MDAAWEPEPCCDKLLANPANADPDLHDLRVALRTPVIEAKQYRLALHYGPRAIEVIAGHWMDLLESPNDLVVGVLGERTSAYHGTILILNSIFSRFNDKINLGWIEIGTEHTKRHKWDGVMTTTDEPKATVMIIEFAGGLGNAKGKKRQDDTIKLYRNAFRVLNESSNVNSVKYPRIFTVLSFNHCIYFELLTLVADKVYVRSRKADINVPTNGSSFKTAMALSHGEMP